MRMEGEISSSDTIYSKMFATGGDVYSMGGEAGKASLRMQSSILKKWSSRE